MHARAVLGRAWMPQARILHVCSRGRVSGRQVAASTTLQPARSRHTHLGEDGLDRRLGRREGLSALIHMASKGLASCLAELLVAATNQTLCTASRENGGLEYGSSSAAGDEKGYLVGLRRCIFDAVKVPPRLRADALLRVVATYDAHAETMGAMAQFAVFAAPARAESE